MTDIAAPPTPVLRRRATLEPLALDPEREIGAGGEAVVYHLPGDAGLVAKLYHDPAIERARKLALMVANPPAMPQGTSIAWPLDVLIHGRGFAGFVMPFAEGPRVFEFYNPVTRRATAPGFHAGLLHRAGRNLAAAFHALHAAGYVVGDVNESNLLVSPGDARVTLVDADSLQVRDPAGGVFRSRVGKPEFTPPELQGVSFGAVDRAPEHDRFGLAVLLYLLLMEGTHPFAARLEPGVEATPVEERIRRGLFPHARLDDDCHPPRLSPRFDALDEGVRERFARAFVAGHADPAARPSAAEWRDALEAAEARLAECAARPLHRFAPHLDACPWCERMALLGGRDPFPADAPASLAAPRPRRQPRRAPVRSFTPPFTFPSPPAAPPAPAPVTPFGVRRARLQALGWPIPPMLGPGGALNPLAVIPAALVLTLFGGPAAAALGFLAILASLFSLAYPQFRRPTPSTVVAAVAMVILALVLTTLPSAPAVPGSVLRTLSTDPPLIADGPAAADPPVIVDAGAAGSEPVRTMYDYLLPDIVSRSVGKSQGSAVPPLPDDGAALPPEGHAPRVTAVDTHPVLANRVLVSRALAALPWTGDTPPSTRADTVLFWLRIGADGRVPAGGWEVISYTSRAGRNAAEAALPYLRYTPARDRGQPVPVWVTQRMVIEP